MRSYGIITVVALSLNLIVSLIYFYFFLQVSAFEVSNQLHFCRDTSGNEGRNAIGVGKTSGGACSMRH